MMIMTYTKTEKWKTIKKENDNSLREFIFGYMQNKKFVSKTMAAGVYMDRYEHSNGLRQDRGRKSSIKRKLSKIFIALAKFGIVDKFNKNTIRINQEKFKELSLEDVLEINIYEKRG